METGTPWRLTLSATADSNADDVDRHLVTRVVAHKDTRAFGRLVERHQSHVRNFLRRLTRDRELAEDLAQDSFLHAWEKMHTYRGTGSVIGWLLKIAYTTFLQSKRKSKRYAEILTAAGDDSEALRDPVTPQRDEITDHERFLAVLEEDERAVMILSYAQGLSHREISEVTSMPVGTIKSIIFRGKEKIRQRFEIGNHQHG